MVSLVKNERTRLTANWLNALSTALIAAGFFAPGAALLYGLAQFATGFPYMLALALGCVALGAAIHVIARGVLGRLHG